MSSKRLPVTLLTGFLGSGKTTLLQKALADPRMEKTAVIINELGDVGIDHLLVGKLDDDAVLLKSGCLCCSLKTDFSDTLLSLFNRRESGKFPPFERVIVETTGLADPVPLLRLLLSSEPINSYYSVRGVVTTVDTLIELKAEESREERLRQIALADHVVLTKTDLAQPERVQAVSVAVRGMNPKATVTQSTDGTDLISALLDDTRYPVVSGLPVQGQFTVLAPVSSKEGFHSNVTTFCLYADGRLPWRGLVRFFKAVAQQYGSQLLRMKGLINVEEATKPVVVHGVEHYLFPETYLDEWPDSDLRSRIVFIVEGIDEREIRDLFSRNVGELAE